MTQNSPSASVSPAFTNAVPDGDDRVREMCSRCGFIHYINPKMVVGSLPLAPDGRVLLCRRAIEPQHGLWTLPAGYMELGETVEEGAAREAWEEARAKLTIGPLLQYFSLKHISQVQMFFAATLDNPDTIEPGPESLEVALFKKADIPWDDLAFPTVKTILEMMD